MTADAILIAIGAALIVAAVVEAVFGVQHAPLRRRQRVTLALIGVPLFGLGVWRAVIETDGEGVRREVTAEASSAMPLGSVK